jgi:hypothetical protein
MLGEFGQMACPRAASVGKEAGSVKHNIQAHKERFS